MNFRRRMLPVVLAAGLCGPALAGDAADWAKPLAGDWTFSGVSEGDPYCRVTLGTEGAIGGAGVDISATCLRNFPFGDVAAWTLRDDGIAFIDPLRKTVIALSKSEDGSYGATLDDGRQVSLDRGAPQEPQSLKDLLDGTFTLSGANDAEACGFAVSARSSTGGTLEQAGACPDRWKGKGWAKWRFAASKLDLLTKKDKVILTMVPADGFTFTAEEDAGPIYFGPGAIQGE
ncbi:AprI/Inh family metalloprotease inhibitor [Shinella zoogloeoides]